MAMSLQTGRRMRCWLEVAFASGGETFDDALSGVSQVFFFGANGCAAVRVAVTG